MRDQPYATEPLGNQHDRAAFSCGVDALDRYFKEQAGQESRRNVARVFVLVDADTGLVAGYYTLSMTAIETVDLPVDLAKRLPRYPTMPAVLIGRLAADSRFQGKGYGAILLVDALRRALEASDTVAAVAVVVDAKDERARQFYERHEFRELTDDGRRLILPMAMIAELFQ